MSEPITFTKEITSIVNGQPIYRFLYNDPRGWLSNFIQTNKLYDYGENQRGEPYYIKYTNSSFGDKYYDVYPIEDDLYEDKYGNIHPVEWGKYNDGSTILPNLEVYPKTAELVLTTYPFFDSNNPISHSEAELIPTYQGGPCESINKRMDAKDYNLFSNNCADGTCSIIELATGKKAKRRLITTPAWVKKFLKENGGVEHKDGTVHLKLNEKTSLAVKQAMKELNKKWGYE